MPFDNTAEQKSATEMIVENTVKLDLLKKKATLGYCRHNIVNPGFKMIEKRWNDRTAQDDAVKKLKQSLETHGSQISKDTSAIPIGLEPSWIAEDSLVQSMEGLFPNEVPMLKLSKDGERAAEAGKIEVFQGGHRKQATTALYNKAVDTQKRCEKSLTRIEKKKEGDFEEEIQKWNELKRKAIKDQAKYSIWSYCIINTSFIDSLDEKTRDDLYSHIARNEQHAIQPETEEELIIPWGSNLLRALREDKAETAKTNASTPVTEAYDTVLKCILDQLAPKYKKIFGDKDMTDMFLKLLTLRSGFRNTEVLKLNFLTKNIGKHHTGFLQEIVRDGFIRLQLMCCTEPFGSFPEAVDLVLTFENATEAENLAWDRKFHQNDAASENLALLNSSCFESIDQAFRTSFYDPVKKGVEPPTWLFRNDDRYHNAISKYSTMVIKALTEKSNVTVGALGTLLSRACFSLRWVPERPPLPLMTISFLKAARHVLDKRRHVIEELCLWFDPVGWYHMTRNNSGDYSSIIVGAIRNDALIADEQKEAAVNQLVKYYLENWSGTVDQFGTALVEFADTISRRPQSKAQFDWHFPKYITSSKPATDPHETQTRFTELDPPNQPYDFFTLNEITRTTVWERTETIRKALSDTERPIRGIFGRNHEDAALRLLSVTSVDFSGKSTRKLLWILIGSAYLETFVMESYRSALLSTSAGSCRRQLEELLSLFTGTGTWRFIDWYGVPTKVGDEDGAGNRALREEAYQAKVDLNIIQGIVQYVEQREVSRSLDESKVDIGVSDALKLLVIELQNNAARRRQRANPTKTNAYIWNDSPWKDLQYTATLRDHNTKYPMQQEKDESVPLTPSESEESQQKVLLPRKDNGNLNTMKDLRDDETSAHHSDYEEFYPQDDLTDHSATITQQEGELDQQNLDRAMLSEEPHQSPVGSPQMGNIDFGTKSPSSLGDDDDPYPSTQEYRQESGWLPASSSLATQSERKRSNGVLATSPDRLRPNKKEKKLSRRADTM